MKFSFIDIIPILCIIFLCVQVIAHDSRADSLTVTNAALTADLEAHALSVVALDKNLELHETSVWGLELALNEVIGDLNDCIEANK